MKVDWIAEFFCAMRDCGEDVSIVYGQKSKASSAAEPQWFELPHDKFDGMSGFGNVLRGQGFRVEQLPVLRDDRFTFGRAVRGLFAVLPVLGIRRRQWLQFDGTRPVRFLPVGQRVAWQLFTEEQTAAIVQAAKAAGVTVNTYLLFHLDAALAPRLEQPASSRRWMIPVNLRGAVTRETEDSPHMSFLAVDLDRNASLSALQARITRLKQQGAHFGSWAALHIGKLLGAKAMRQDIRNREKKNHGWTGIFSNLGVWEVPDCGSWIFCPAITRAYPVGAGCVTMNGRMALTLQLHDGFAADLQTSRTLLEAWKQACLQEANRYESATSRLALGAVG